MIKRSFILGDEWLYYKIYSGAKTSDLILTEVIRPVAGSLLKENTIDKWFFLRYGDPKPHIRVRFHYENPKDLSNIVNYLRASLIEYINEDLIWKIQTDTYNRELERYGINTIELSETLFFYDSEATINFLSLIEGNKGEELRWLFGLRIINTMLNCFLFTTEQKCNLMKDLKSGFGNEFGMNRFLKKQLDDKYRQERKKIEHFLSFDVHEIPDYSPILHTLSNYKNNILPIADKLNYLNSQNKLKVDMDNLLSSYIHMSMNRLFKSKNRVHEMVCYDFLYRQYRSLIARKKKKNV